MYSFLTTGTKSRSVFLTNLHEYLKNVLCGFPRSARKCRRKLFENQLIICFYGHLSLSWEERDATEKG